MKRVILISILLLLVFCGCNIQQPSDLQETTPSIVYQDGLSPDKTFYQLTDKDGIVVRIPLGKPIGNGAVYVTPASAWKKRSSDGALGPNDGVYVFSELSVISFGYGNVKNPITGENVFVLGQEPYSVPENYVLIIQYTNENYQTVACDSPDAYAMNIFVLDYKTMPGNFLFKEVVQLRRSDDLLLFSCLHDTVVPGERKTTTYISNTYDSYTGDWYYYHSVQETQEFDVLGGTYTLTFKDTRYGPDGELLNWAECTYYDNYNLESETLYGSNGKVVARNLYNEDGNLAGWEEYDEEGFLLTKYQKSGNVTAFESFDRDGNVTGRGKTTQIDDMHWIDETESYIENTAWYAEYVNGERVKDIQYPQGLGGSYIVRVFSTPTDWVEEFYDAEGNMTVRYEYVNGQIASQTP